MEAAYNLSLLFEETEIDVMKGCSRYGSKEAFFSVLHRFTLDIERLLKTFRSKMADGAQDSMDDLGRWADRLKGLLASIGAINLAWKVQSVKQIYDAKRESEFLEKLEEVLLEVESFRSRIDNAQKTNDFKDVQPKTAGGDSIHEEQERRIRLHRADFEKLFMLIDNFELDSAAKTAISIMREHYNPEIDETLTGIYKALGEFDYTKSIEEARGLMNTVNGVKESETHEMKTILAIDDLPGVLMTVEAMLKGKYKVYCMADYSSAAKFLTNNTVDLILLDIEMPGIDGFAMIQLFRSIPEYAETPIIFLTSHGTDEHIKTAMSLGARDFIRKPVDLGVLLKKLESAFLK